MVDNMTHYLGVDCSTKGKGLLIRFLERRKGVLAVEDHGPYREDPSISRLWLDAEFDEEALDNLLDQKFNPPRKSKAEAYGTFTRQNYLKSDGYLFDRLDAQPIGV